MININLRNKRKCLLFFASVLGVFLLMYLFSGSNFVAAEANNEKKSGAPKQKPDNAATKTADNIISKTVVSSLEMKENVDFLLSPALLIQEVLSDDIITTYPSE